MYSRKRSCFTAGNCEWQIKLLHQKKSLSFKIQPCSQSYIRLYSHSLGCHVVKRTPFPIYALEKVGKRLNFPFLPRPECVVVFALLSSFLFLLCCSLFCVHVRACTCGGWRLVPGRARPACRVTHIPGRDSMTEPDTQTQREGACEWARDRET